MPDRELAEQLSAADRAHRGLRRAIVDGEYPPGTMLSENELGAALGVSRTPIRSALTRLQDEGWIVIYPRRGALVVGLTPLEARDLADARHVLESSGVQRATVEQRRRLAAELRDSVEQQRQALAAGDIPRFVDLTTAFHRAFVRVGGNGFLIEVSDRLSDRLRQLLFAQDEGLLARQDATIAEHHALLDHLAADDPAAFAEALREHLADALGHGLGGV